MKKLFVCFLLLVWFVNFNLNGQIVRSDDYYKARRSYIDNLISKMTLEEKLGQLNLPTTGDISTGSMQNTDVAKKIEMGLVGGLFNIKSVQKIRDFQKIAVEKSRLKIPLLFGMDVIHGYETTFPIPLALSCSWNMELIKNSAKIAASEASAQGINWTFSPMVDIARDPRWGRIAEGAGEDPYLGGQVAKAMVNGYQGDDLTKNNTILSCVKHFALYGAPDGGRDYNTVDMSRIKMYNDYFPPYKAAIEAGVGSVMTSFNEIDGIPATGNKWLMTDVLRNQWGFKGFVVTDYTAINEMIHHGMGDLQKVSALALNAGVEMDMVGEGFLTTLSKSMQEHKVTIDKINQACRLILEAKYDLGLFDDPYLYCDENRAKNDVFTDKNRKIAREFASETFVLLKNDNNILPLKKSQKIALIGPLADMKENMPGTWSVATDFSKAVSVIAGFEEAGINFKYAKGCKFDYSPVFEKKVGIFGKPIKEDARSTEELYNEAENLAINSDVIVLTLGECAEMSGESSSRSDIRIPQSQRDLLIKLSKLNKPIVLLLFNGRPLDISEELPLANSILDVWFPGTEAGYAIADAVFGKTNPSGKLTATFPRNVGQIPIYYNHKNTGRPISKDALENCKFEKFRSNYLDVCNTPLFPFGYGLSYSNFEYSNLQLSGDKLSQNSSLEISVDVANIGKYDGKETVQLYIRDVVGSVTRPVKELKGFQKVFIRENETKTVKFKITIDDLKFYDYNLNYIAEPGEFEVFVGANSEDLLASKFILD